MDREQAIAALDFAAARAGYHVPLHAALDGLTPAQAAWRPDDGGHTIRQLAQHLLYWKTKVVRSLAGEAWTPTADNDATFGEPGDPADGAGWGGLAVALHAAYEALDQQAATHEAGGDPPLHVILTWVATHDAYHTGQIMLLRKRQGAWP